MNTDTVKRDVAFAVVDRYVRSGMRIGLGTGSTAIHAVRRVGELLTSGTLSDIVAVPTSYETMLEAQRLGIPLATLNDAALVAGLDLAIDGADEVDTTTGYLIKGGGGAHTLEKLVEYRARILYVVVDESKLSASLGSRFRIPVEVIPAAVESVRLNLEPMVGTSELGMAQRKAGPVVTDNGNMILDVQADGLPIDAASLEQSINSIPGVLENGLFTRISTEVWVGRADGSVDTLSR